MVFFLVIDVGDDIFELRMRIGEDGKSLLPCKFSRNPSFSVDEFGGIYFDVPYEIGDWKVRGYANEDMNVVGHGIDLHHLLFPLRDDAGNVFVEFRFVLLGD